MLSDHADILIEWFDHILKQPEWLREVVIDIDKDGRRMWVQISEDVDVLSEIISKTYNVPKKQAVHMMLSWACAQLMLIATTRHAKNSGDSSKPHKLEVL